MNRNALSILKISLFTLLGLFIVAYSIFQAWKLITGPVIDLSSPENGTTYNQPLIEISGHARNTAHLTLNDRAIFTDTEGNFSEKLLLSPGYNIIILDATDKFKARTEKKLEVILKEY